MKKKLILLTLLTTLFCAGFLVADLLIEDEVDEPVIIKEPTPKNPVPKKEYKRAGDFSYFKQIDKDNIVKAEITDETVAGPKTKTTTDSKEIRMLFNTLENTNLGEATEMVCNDYSTTYRFIDQNDRELKITIECGQYMYLGNNGYEMEAIPIEEDFD